MRSLLHFQAVALTRNYGNPLVGLCVASVGVAAWYSATSDGFLAGIYAVVAFLVAAVLVVGGMVFTFDALDAVRWTSPIRPRATLSAYIAFWAALCVVPAAAFSLVHADDTQGAALLFVAAMMLVHAAAFAVPFFHRVYRRTTTKDAALAAILVLLLAGLSIRSIVLACAGEPLLALGPAAIAFVAATALGARSVLGDERLPVASGVVERMDVAPPRRSPRTPAAAVGVATSPVLAWLWVLMGLGFQFVWVNGWFPFPAYCLLLAVPQLALVALPSCRWLLATPMSRERMFLRVLGPIALFLVVGVGARFCVLEFQTDRIVFFDTFRPASQTRQHHPNALVLGHLWEVDEERHVYRPPDITVMSARLSEHLWRTFGADVSPERIETSIRRGWPSPGPALNGDASYEWQQTFFDAMDRLHVELKDEIAAADRRRNLLIAGIVVLLGLALLHTPPANAWRRLGSAAFILLVMAVVLVPQTAPNSAATRVLLSWRDALHGSLQHTDSGLRWLWLVGWAVVAVALWKFAERSFRRLDLTDLPPSPVDSLRRSRGA